MHLFIGSDHAGFELKQQLLQFFKKKTIDYDDMGTFTADSVDYPDIAVKVSRNVMKNNNSVGLLICGSGIGMSIVANKIPGIRAALCNTINAAELSRLHNNANLLCMGARIIQFDKACKIIDKFLSTYFSNKIRHHKRVKKIHDLTGV